jgi:hypothetical protein
MAKKPKKPSPNSIADALKGAPSAAASSGKAIYIGIPAGSEAEQQGILKAYGVPAGPSPFWQLHGTPTSGVPYAPPTLRVTPKYKIGSELEPATWDPNDLLALQQRLAMAGMLSGYVPGTFDTATRKAYRDLLSTANASGSDWNDVLDQINKAGGKQGKAPPPLSIQYTNAQDLTQVADKVAQTLYGGNLSDADKQKFIDSYHAMEAQAQTEQYNVTYGNAAQGTFTAPPAASAAVETQIRQEHPNEVFANSLRDALMSSSQAGGTGVLDFLKQPGA